MIDLHIKIDPRNRGKFFQKSPRFAHSSSAREIAIKDIAKDVIENDFYNKNYIQFENIVLIACGCKMQILTIDTTIL